MMLILMLMPSKNLFMVKNIYIYIHGKKYLYIYIHGYHINIEEAISISHIVFIYISFFDRYFFNA